MASATRGIRPVALMFALAGLLLAGSASADSFALTARAGTPGLGVEGAWRLGDALSLRAGLSAFDYSTDFEEAGIDYDGELELRNAAIFADWHPFGGSFRLSSGVVYNGNELLGQADGRLEVGNETFDAVLDAKIDWRSFAPYLGIGFGSPFSGGNWSFALDLGVMFTGTPGVTLNGTVSDPAFEDAFRDELERERRNLQQEVSDFKYYPVVSIGLNYRF